MNFFTRIWTGLTNNPQEEALAHMLLVFVVEGLLAAGSAVLQNIGILSTQQMLAVFGFVLVSTVTHGIIKYIQAHATNQLVALLATPSQLHLPVIEKQLAEDLHIAAAKGPIFGMN